MTIGHDPDRIRAIIERSMGKHVCPLCGYPKFTGAIHSYAGQKIESKNTTRWCTGGRIIEPKDNPKTFEWQCSTCKQVWFYSQDEMEVADSDGLCHECVEKNK